MSAHASLSRNANKSTWNSIRRKALRDMSRSLHACLTLSRALHISLSLTAASIQPIRQSSSATFWRPNVFRNIFYEPFRSEHSQDAPQPINMSYMAQIMICSSLCLIYRAWRMNILMSPTRSTFLVVRRLRRIREAAGSSGNRVVDHYLVPRAENDGPDADVEDGCLISSRSLLCV